MDHKRIKVALVAGFVAASLIIVSAQEPQLRTSSYAPVDIKEPFATTMNRMKSTKAEVMRRQMALLNERYDLSRRVSNDVTMSRGKPIPVGPAARLATGVTWEKLAQMSPEETRSQGLFPKG